MPSVSNDESKRLTHARLTLVVAAVLWSLGSFFTRLFSTSTVFELDTNKIEPLHIAFYRGLFAGCSLLPLLRIRDIRIKPLMVGMVACFGVMSGLYISALGLGSAANAILLQNTAPFWVYVIGVYLLGDPADRRSWRAILVGILGAVVIVGGNWPRDSGEGHFSHEAMILLMGLGSGLTYAAVVLFLRKLRSESSAWLTVMNLIGSAMVILGFVMLRDGWSATITWLAVPTGKQLMVLALFGAVQMAIPYWLFARGLRTVGAQEAGIITLLEPVLNPIWAYMIAPEAETPTIWTALGGFLLLGALAWRYFPSRTRV